MFSREKLAWYFIGVSIKEFILGLSIGAALKKIKVCLGATLGKLVAKERK